MITKKGTYGLLGSAKTISRGRARGRGRPFESGKRVGPAHSTSALGFGAESSDDDEVTEDPLSRAAVNRRLAAEQKMREGQVDKKHCEAVETYASVFEYDSVYDGLKEKEQQQLKVTGHGGSDIMMKEKKPKSKYVASLMQQAKLKEVEQDRVYERKLAREAKDAEEEMGKVDMKFITSAYKNKLMEKRKWELREAMEEKKEEKARDAMLGGGGLTGFYSNLLTKNVAMGGSVEEHAKSSFTSGSKRHTETAAYDPDTKYDSSAGDSDDMQKTGEGDSPVTKRIKAPGDDMLEETVEERAVRYRKADEERAQEEKEEAERKVLEEELAMKAEAEAKARRDERISAAKRRALERKQQQQRGGT